jgi:hypothetical protein
MNRLITGFARVLGGFSLIHSSSKNYDSSRKFLFKSDEEEREFYRGRIVQGDVSDLPDEVDWHHARSVTYPWVAQGECGE